MKFTQALAALGAFGAVSVAFPAEQDADESIATTLYQETANFTRFWHPAIERENIWKKYNTSAPEDVVLAAEKVRKGSVKNMPGAQDNFYLVATKIGNPPQTVHLDFDTGSSDLWTYSSESPPSVRGKHSFYKPGKSSTSKRKPGYTWRISYGDGSTARGNVFQDTLRLGPLVIKNQIIEAAKSVTGSAARGALDGIFGSGFKLNNEVRPVKANMWYQNINLKKKVFCANLKHGKPGTYDLGFINPKHHSGPIHYTAVGASTGYWALKPTGFAIGKGRKQGSTFVAIADTGTTLAYLPAAAARKYYRHVKGAKYVPQAKLYVFPCNAKLPSFSVFIGGSRRTIPGKLINAGKVGTLNGRVVCGGGIQSSAGQGVNILGDTFLKSQYVVFDFGAKRIGFANKA